MDKAQPLSAIIEEEFIQSKTGNSEDCEDAIHLSPHSVAVIDGATSKTSRRWNHETGGRVAAKLIDQAFAEMPYDFTARQAANLMTAKINDFYESFDAVESVKADAVQRITASFAAISLFRQEVWLIGDCQVFLGEQKISNEKNVDRILSEARSLFLELEILKGATIEQLLEKDTGREFIMPLLAAQSLMQNNPGAGEYWFPAVDGFPIPDAGIIVKPIPNEVDSVVLATDGYPVLENSLEESENMLGHILAKDPLMFREYKSTKGKLKDDVSFDDRAFIKVKIER